LGLVSYLIGWSSAVVFSFAGSGSRDMVPAMIFVNFGGCGLAVVLYGAALLLAVLAQGRVTQAGTEVSRG
jgi:hypothetical protein